MPDSYLAVLNALVRRGTPQTVAHYTDFGALTYIVGGHGQPSAAVDATSSGGLRSLWATPVHLLNDREDLWLGLDELRQAVDRHGHAGEMVDDVDKMLSMASMWWYEPEYDPYQISFSGDTDDLGQWRGYAENGRGCALVVRTADLRRLADVAGAVVYDKDQQQRFADSVIDKAIAHWRSWTTIDRGRYLAAAACYMKNAGFRSEREFRMLFFADHQKIGRRARFRGRGSRVLPYIDVLDGLEGGAVQPPALEQVILGPGCQLPRPAGDGPLETEQEERHFRRDPTVLGVRRLLQANGLHGVPVVPSRIPYDPR